MKTNKKWFVRTVSCVAALTLSVSMLAGCGNNATDKNEDGKTVVSVGSWPSKEGKSLDNINARKARFEEANPDVAIEPSYWMFDRKTFYAKAAGDQLPTIFEVGFTEMPEIINSDLSADLTDVLKKRGYDGMFNEDVLDIISDNEGRIKAFPFNSYVLGMVFNTELMKQAGLMEEDGTPKQPKDWYELAEFAKQIKDKTGKPGFMLPTANKNGGWMFSPIAWSFGVDFMEKGSDGKWKATFNSPEATEALQYVKDLKWKYDVLPSNTLIDLTEYYKVFATGGAGMMMASGGYTSRLPQYGMKPEQSGIMGLPEGPKRNVTLLGGAVYCLNSSATEEQIDAAIRWIETAYNFNLTEEFKNNTITSLDKNIEDGMLIGPQQFSPWSESSEALIWNRQTINEKANSNPNYVKVYNEYVSNCPAEIQPEEPVCCQELYEILDGCIQEVLTNKDADCATLLEKANADFQSNYLDNLTY